MSRPTRSEERAWRALLAAARDPQACGALLAAVTATAGCAMPCAAGADQALLVALTGIARAYGKGRADRRERLGGALQAVVAECEAVLDEPSSVTRDVRDGAPDLQAAGWMRRSDVGPA